MKECLALALNSNGPPGSKLVAPAQHGSRPSRVRQVLSTLSPLGRTGLRLHTSRAHTGVWPEVASLYSFIEGK